MSTVEVRTFPFRFDPRYALMLRAGGIRPDNSAVEIGDGRFAARFGRWTVETPIPNLARFEVTGGYHWWKAIGVRGSLVDGGLTFGSNAERGVCVCFVEPVDRIAPLVAPRHPGLTVTVADVDGMVDVLRGYGVAG